MNCCTSDVKPLLGFSAVDGTSTICRCAMVAIGVIMVISLAIITAFQEEEKEGTEEMSSLHPTYFTEYPTYPPTTYAYPTTYPPPTVYPPPTNYPAYTPSTYPSSTYTPSKKTGSAVSSSQSSSSSSENEEVEPPEEPEGKDLEPPEE